MTEEQAEKRMQISVSVDEHLREQLESAAKRSIRSLSGEAAFRLMRSFEFDHSQNDSAA
jgi:hypothetical protein